MLLDLDIYRVARALVDAHGDEAPIHGTRRADAALQTGDVRGWAEWLEILAAAETLLARRPLRPAEAARNAL
jgi:hypothetical protein